MNDYYRVVFALTPANTDACDLLADALADAGYESFEPADDGTSLTAYVPADLFDPEKTAIAEQSLPFETEISRSEEFIEGRDWNSEWERNYFKPIVVAGEVAVHSSFHTDVPHARYDIVIDPRMAFGTGHHATTTLMMQSVLANVKKGDTVIDMGTGTGILAILAYMAGAREVEAIEIDPFAADNARDNVALNLAPDANVTIHTGDASLLAPMPAKADLFLANINRNIITADIAAYAAAMKPGALITVSGFYTSDCPIVAEAAHNAGLSDKESAQLDNWCSMTFVKH